MLNVAIGCPVLLGEEVYRGEEVVWFHFVCGGNGRKRIGRFLGHRQSGDILSHSHSILQDITFLHRMINQLLLMETNIKKWFVDSPQNELHIIFFSRAPLKEIGLMKDQKFLPSLMLFLI
jgi:hypothetical protein